MKIYLATHGESEKDRPDPPLTEKGKQQMRELKGELPKVDYVISGKSTRCKESCFILTGKKADLETEKAGVIETLSSDGKKIIFPNGKEILLTEYMKSLKRKLPEIQRFLQELLQKEEVVLIVGGRIVAIAVGVSKEEVRSAHIYCIERTSSGISVTENPDT